MFAHRPPIVWTIAFVVCHFITFYVQADGIGIRSFHSRFIITMTQIFYICDVAILEILISAFQDSRIYLLLKIAKLNCHKLIFG